MLSGKQAAFLAFSGREAFYGGAAGGGKSWALLMAALQHVDDPRYRALILRRTYKQMSKADSIMSTSQEWLSGKAKWNGEAHKWTFPSGATLEFGHMEHAKSIFDYQGAAWHYVGYDELTQFHEAMYTYLFSRQRRRKASHIPTRMRSAGNPGGVGHVWVKARFIADATRAAGRLFVPAKLHDNLGIDVEDYLPGFAQLDPVTRAQLLEGNWDAIPSGRFKREALDAHRYRVVDEGFGQGGAYLFPGGRRVQRDDCWVFLTCDPAATAEGIRKTGDPDYTVVAAWAVTPSMDLLWLDCHRFRLEIPDVVPQIRSVYARHGPRFVAIEAVASNRGVLQLAQRTGMVVREVSPKGADKIVRAAPAMILSGAGRLWLPARAHWLDDAVTELLLFTGDGKTHDDQVDALSYACDLMQEFDGQASDARPMALSGRGW